MIKYLLFSAVVFSIVVVTQDHNCVRELRVLVTQQQCKITELQTDNAELKLQMNELKREVQTLKVRNRQLPFSLL